MFIFLEFIHVKNQIKNNPVQIDNIGLELSSGNNTPKYPSKATVIAAFVHQIEIQ